MRNKSAGCGIHAMNALTVKSKVRMNSPLKREQIPKRCANKFPPTVTPRTSYRVWGLRALVGGISIPIL